MLNEKNKHKVVLSLTDTQEVITQPVARRHIKQWNMYQVEDNLSPTDLRILRAVVKLQNVTTDLSRLSCWHRVFRSKKWKYAKKHVEERHALLIALVEKSEIYLKSYNKIMGLDSKKQLDTN